MEETEGEQVNFSDTDIKVHSITGDVYDASTVVFVHFIIPLLSCGSLLLNPKTLALTLTTKHFTLTETY